MVGYRVEVSPNNRAGCKDIECQKTKEKITKGMLRFGTWVTVEDHSSWAWKHWGCVSGRQLQNVRDLCEQDDGTLDYDAIDGFSELADHPNLQEKVRRCVAQGFIDPEDFNGDAEKNKPGEKGIHLTVAQKRKMEKAASNDDDDEDHPKVKKGRKPSTIKVIEDDQEEEEPAPAKPAHGKKAAAKVHIKTEPGVEAPVAPAKKAEPAVAPASVAIPTAGVAPPFSKATFAVVLKARKASVEKTDDEADEQPTAVRRPRRAAAKVPVIEIEDDSDEKPVPKAPKGKDDDFTEKPAPKISKGKARRGRPRKV